MWFRLRVAVLLFILASVAVSAWQSKSRATSWQGTLQVALIPINADASPATVRYLESLEPETFQPMADFLNGEAHRYGIDELRPVAFSLAPPQADQPPAPLGRGMLETIAWSLQLRYWAWRHTPKLAPKPSVRLYLLYHDPASNPRLPHSAGLERGQIGVVHLFASRQQAAENLVVAAHELLHTLGASDKYDPASNQPRYPDGYAEPQRQPRLPQDKAELMAGRIPLSADRAAMPAGLQEALVGPASAREIGWQRRP